MGDWTTKVISDNLSIDLHPDLDSFPAQLTSKVEGDFGVKQVSILLNKKEAHDLMLKLIEHFGGVYSG